MSVEQTIFELELESALLDCSKNFTESEEFKDALCDYAAYFRGIAVGLDDFRTATLEKLHGASEKFRFKALTFGYMQGLSDGRAQGLRDAKKTPDSRKRIIKILKK